jgi:aminoglycoside phosphotransferase (APT) family kinase protein
MASMHRSAPLAIESTNLSDHPAALAWGRLGGGALSTVEMWRRPTRTSPSVYRLILAGDGHVALFAKRFPTNLPSVERTVYEEILPRLPVTAPRYHGACLAEDGSTWMFLEDVGDQRMTADDPGHRALAARWIGTLHASGAAGLGAARLPDAGAGRYLAHLRSGRDILRQHVGNPWLATKDRPLLTDLIGRLGALEARWSRVESACAGLPRTLVHGDFRPKNVRVRVAGGPAAFYPFDWEMAGWGIPAADLGGAFGAGPTVPFDARIYREVVQDVWKALDDDLLRRISNVGRLFQALASTDWACASLVVESARHMIRPVTSLRLCRTQLCDAIEEGAGWLEWS